MADLVLHPRTAEQLQQYSAVSTHAILITGQKGSGKIAVAHQLATGLLQIKTLFEDYPYKLIISPLQHKAIGIAPIREVEHFLSLKVPNDRKINRVVLIEDSHTLTIEAQNALLKTLEEPPLGTVIIMTAAYEQNLLPTIRSRVQVLALQIPKASQLTKYFTEQGSTEVDIIQANNISGGLPGLMHAILNDVDHPLLVATRQARSLLGQSTYERLSSVDDLVKHKELAIDMLQILQQMAHISLGKASPPASIKWQTIMTASYEAQVQLMNSAQPKLALTNLMLSL